MTREALATLFHPFETGDIAAPGAGTRVLFLGAEPGFRLPQEFGAVLTTVQGFRPHFLSLQRAGHAVVPEPAGEGYDMALVLAGRHRGENESRLAEALRRTAEGGLILVAGSKDDGIASLRKRVGALLAIEDSVPKHHGIAFWLRRPSDAGQAVGALLASSAPATVDGRFVASPGMFSHDRVDAGSRLLAENLPAGLKGLAADFCAGWGFLSVSLAGRAPDVERIDLFEADHASLDAARKNMAALAPSVAAGFHWLDLASEKVARRYDAVVMNPPFHQGRAAEPDLGEKMIRAASAALKPGGRLFMVANRQLPYEPTIAAGFASQHELTRDGGFKVIVARR